MGDTSISSLVTITANSNVIITITIILNDLCFFGCFKYVINHPIVQQKIQIDTKNFIGFIQALIPSIIVLSTCVRIAHVIPPGNINQPNQYNSGLRNLSCCIKFILKVLCEVLFYNHPSYKQIHQQTYRPKHESK